MYSIVIVTYNNDFDKLQICLQSLYLHLKNTDVPVLIILNDTEEHLEALHNITDQYNNIKVLHHRELGSWTHSLDWWSQQYFKLAVSNIISTPWYLLIDSDDVFINSVNNHLFDQGRARCLTEPFINIKNSANPSLLVYVNRAYKFIGHTELPDATMGNLTPFMMNTQVTRELFSKIGSNWADTRYPDSLTLEFYLYYAYLDQQDLFDSLYSPVKFLGYSVDKRVDTIIKIL
jgi:hypothetical protein